MTPDHQTQKPGIVEEPARQNMVCPWWLCFTFDNPLRKLLHNPEAILSPYVHPGDCVIDIGAGMGYFTIPLARLVGPEGHVIAIDVQEKMLSALRSRAKKHGVSERIEGYLASQKSLGNHEKADFILTFWMAHEVPDQSLFFREVRDLLKPNGLLLLAEPIIHVSQKYFLRTLQSAIEIGLVVKENPKIRLSHSALLGFGK
ncbi:MAG: class I SAM-dependent methyltransferase [Deltaproteobacteria bacterium]|nr:class I SAM-dependent methyltransferase [Deltaproteobacteria bacterium]